MAKGPDSYVARVWVTKLYVAEATGGGDEERGGAESGLIGVNGLRSKADRRRDVAFDSTEALAGVTVKIDV
ncbi:hypothetical protein Bca52824_075563 [Brassica carinata]|uniref:Uncharacterized protein n=1 Tax=Brassica carinata TaxID=52824 RepID=A0A8X7PVB3_BRACI|nr:hypothetical protein Bca52824_075563 [Brassica carinata]